MANQEVTRLGHLIYVQRKKRNLSQQQLGSMVGIAQTAISALERGVSQGVYPKYIRGFAERLGCSEKKLHQLNLGFKGTQSAKYELGKLVRRLRAAQGLTQCDLDRLLGKVRYVHNFENRLKQITVELAFELCRVLHCDQRHFQKFIRGSGPSATELGNILRTARLAKGKNIARVARKCKKTRAWLSAVEKGKKGTTEQNLKFLARELDLDYQALLQLLPPRKHPVHSAKIGRLFSAVRLEEDLGVCEVARRIGISHSYYRHLERGLSRYPDPEIMVRWQQVLSCPIPLSLLQELR